MNKTSTKQGTTQEAKKPSKAKVTVVAKAKKGATKKEGKAKKSDAKAVKKVTNGSAPKAEPKKAIVDAIRKLHKDGQTMREIAAHFIAKKTNRDEFVVAADVCKLTSPAHVRAVWNLEK